jgi:hypothetical protein
MVTLFELCPLRGFDVDMGADERQYIPVMLGVQLLKSYISVTKTLNRLVGHWGSLTIRARSQFELAKLPLKTMNEIIAIFWRELLGRLLNPNDSRMRGEVLVPVHWSRVSRKRDISHHLWPPEANLTTKLWMKPTVPSIYTSGLR